MASRDHFHRYFQLTLLSHLIESFPEKLGDTNFINSKSQLASEIYADSILNGLSDEQANESANKALYWGLHFSKHDTIINVLWNEFFMEIPQGGAKEFAIKILPECEDIFAQYQLTDSFIHSSDYKMLYKELTGVILIWLENNNTK